MPSSATPVKVMTKSNSRTYGTANETSNDKRFDVTETQDDDYGRQGICGINFFVYFSHFMSAWGSRMWSFAVGLFLVAINPESLQLTAVYGLVQGATVLLLGPVVGDWVDITPRLKAARVTLILQNLLIIICAIFFYLFIVYNTDFTAVGTWVEYTAYGVIIVISSAANLASIANTIAVEKDWIVEISGRNEEKLASMTSTMKVIDQVTLILAPIATGQVVTYANTQNGALLIAAWNAMSFIIEYYLLWKVYNTVPALSKKKDMRKVDSQSSNKNESQEANNSCSCRMFSRITIILTGWKTYVTYDVWMSGLALSFLYMTVLGFDNVTVGYAEIQGLSGSVLGLLQGAAGAFGITGAMLYPKLRRKLGLPRTGLLGLCLLTATLAPCVVSVWLPGSPFDLSKTSIQNTTNCTSYELNNSTLSGASFTEMESQVDSHNSSSAAKEIPCSDENNSLVSIYVLMGGIVAARAGLWMTDLSINQMFMETVEERERGVVNGVQSAMNQLMSMVEFALVTAFPLAQQFGLLVILSYSFIASGAILHAIFNCRINTFNTGTYDIEGGPKV